MAALQSPRDQFVLFGASIIHQASTGASGCGLVSALQQAYGGQVDVAKRGFSGYNTRMALKKVSKVLPDPAKTRVRFMLILFGSNDACFEGERKGRHVSIHEYRENLRKIVTHPSVEAHNPRVLLVTPPPIEERLLGHRLQSQGYAKINRSNVVTERYAETARQVAEDVGVACVDLWAACMAKAGWKPGDPLYGSKDLPENPVIRRLFHDGLHLTPEAYQIFYDEIMKTIAETWPDQRPEVPRVVPSSDDSAAPTMAG